MKTFLPAGTGVAALAGSLFIGIVQAPAIKAQTVAGATPKFEVISIKPCKGGDGNSRAGGSASPVAAPGRLSVNCNQVEFLIREAYLSYADGHYKSRADLFVAPIEGAPAWLQSERFSIEAKAEGRASQELMFGPMLRALLEDRFKLKIHHEASEVPVYELTVAKGGPKLQPFDGSCTNPYDWTKPPQFPAPPRGPGDCRNSSSGTSSHWTAYWRGISIDSLVLTGFPHVDGRSVVNKTGIAGLFDIHLDYALDQNSDAAPSLFEALQKQLGLKLVPARGLGETLVIDHVERPSQN